ncbi:carbohydrate ABC transporter substrate-binding protein, CUT1 family [Streptomyces sp. DvalAA-14]|uniref:ABC transporter substrate-binding protein n=1 Tax=unclassified Streptomyces TaxID=2593676 RepID=UPI00081B26ED|nr:MULTISPECIES: extracellular solute-binding protein [unclassified Streptomyces]MYS21158.1 extracellular solute-binding protein [Streptomyces sp. SID4948]SCD85574.1 carbohydrate ABC transporter substrate-binding protein, CUT1 family [Streptomyces sp. DvalAA-14]
MTKNGYRRLVAVALVAGIGLTGAACSSNNDKGGGDSSSKPSAAGSSAGTPLDPKTKVTISVDCEPPTTKAAERKQWIDDVAEFNKTYPNVTVKSKDAFPCEDPAKFTAQLQAGSETDTFYTYMTDLQQVLDSGQAADISDYINAKTIPNLNNIDSGVLNVLKDGGKLYGLPTSNYQMGLIYNRKIFSEAGLDPNKPPTTWDEIRTDAKTIQDKLGSKGINGFMENAGGNQGGWHLVSEMFGVGSKAVNDDATKAAFNNAQTKSVLTTLQQMRWTDKSLPATPGLQWGDVQKAMGTGKIGMYVGAPDDVPLVVQQYKADYKDLGMAPIPGGQTALFGGNDYMFKKSDTPDQIKAGIAWVNFKFLTLGKGQFNYARNKADGLPVGLPEPFFFTGAAKDQDTALKTASATIPVDNFKTYVDAQVPVLPEPPNAQKIYTVLDTVMSGVLTNKSANIDKLLSTAETQVNSLLAASQ